MLEWAACYIFKPVCGFGFSVVRVSPTTTSASRHNQTKAVRRPDSNLRIDRDLGANEAAGWSMFA